MIIVFEDITQHTGAHADILNFVQFGLMQIIAHEEALTILARSVDPRDASSMLEAVQLLGAICLVPPDGYFMLLSSSLDLGIDTCSVCGFCSI